MSDTGSATRAEAISLRQLRLFEAIGDLESVRRASEECRLSQPAVTQALARLEEQAGARLVDRRASGSYLNALGEIFHARVKRFFDRAEAAVAETGTAATPAAAKSAFNRLTRSQLRALIAIVEHGSIEAAATALGISASSLQRSARDLEGNLRISLFYRTAAGMLVSPVGTRFGRQMKLALQEVELGVDEIEAAEGGSSRPIVIGAMPFGGSVLLAAALDDFLRAHPRADVRIVSDSAAAMAQSLKAGDVDLVIGLLPEIETDELESDALAETPYSVVVRRGHPLAARDRVTRDDLAGCDWVIGTPGSSRRGCFDRLFAGAEAPQAAIATCSTPIVRQLLECSDRVTLMTTYELLYADGRLSALPVDAIGEAPSIGVTTRVGWLPTPLHADFIATVRAHVHDMGAEPPRLHAVG